VGTPGVGDAVAEVGTSQAIFFGEILLDLVGKNLACIPGILMGIYHSLFPPEAIIVDAVFEAFAEFSERAIDGIFQASLNVTLDWCWGEAPYVEFTDCGFWGNVTGANSGDPDDSVGSEASFSLAMTSLKECLFKSTPFLWGSVPTPFINAGWNGSTWCAPDSIQNSARGLIGAFQYMSGGRMLEDLIIVGDNLLTKLQERLEDVFCDRVGDFTVTLGVQISQKYGVIAIRGQGGCVNGSFAGSLIASATGRIPLFDATFNPFPKGDGFFSIACDKSPIPGEWSYWGSSLIGVVAFGPLTGIVSLPLYPTPKLEFGYTFLLTLFPKPPVLRQLPEDEPASLAQNMKSLSRAVSTPGFASELPDPVPILEGARNGSLRKAEWDFGGKVAITIAKSFCLTCEDFGDWNTATWLTGLASLVTDYACNVSEAQENASWGFDATGHYLSRDECLGYVSAWEEAGNSCEIMYSDMEITDLQWVSICACMPDDAISTGVCSYWSNPGGDTQDGPASTPGGPSAPNMFRHHQRSDTQYGRRASEGAERAADTRTDPRRAA
jgi:hypothetical protein